MTIATRVRTRPVPPHQRLQAPSALAHGTESSRPKFICVAVDQLKPANNRVRKRGKGQVAALTANIKRFGCLLPVLVTAEYEIIDGHAVWEVCRALGHATIPVAVVSHLGEAEIKTLRISLHALAAMSEFDDPALALDLKFIFKVDPLLIGHTALPMPKIDALFLGSIAKAGEDSTEAMTAPSAGPAVTVLGDRWVCAGGCVFYCGDAKDPASYRAALLGQTARMILSDVPYALVPIKGVVSRRHLDFVEGSSMDEAEADAFFLASLQAMVEFADDGAIIDLFIDHRGMYSLIGASRKVALEHLCIVTWNKVTPAMGGLYRHQAEYVLVLKKGKRSHINNVKLGKYGRNRSTIWAYPGLAGFGAGRGEALASHPTVKPIGLLIDAILDVTNPGDLVLDPFVGSGSTVLAAFRANRIGVGIDLDPKYIDTAVQRFEAFSGEPVRHAETGLTFAETARLRAATATVAPNLSGEAV